MPTDTDTKLRNWLDSNQRHREQMCLAILALDEHYSDVRPRHPSGGPDDGRDIEAIYDSERVAFGAVGFANGANDSSEQKKQIRKKFAADLTSALKAKSDLKVFAFLTNIHLTMGEQDALKQKAKKAGIEHCDILDRERLRIELDAPGGFFIRFQYLSIAMSEAEQASFLAKYGAQIQDVVTTGFQKVGKTLNRLLFLAESSDALDTLTFRFVLKKAYPASEIGHFRAFVMLSLREVRLDMFMIWFGSSDCSDRHRNDMTSESKDMTPGIGNGLSSGQWERYIRAPREDEEDEDEPADEQNPEAEKQREAEIDEALRFKQTSWSSGIGMDPVPALIARFRHDAGMVRFRPRLSLREFDGSMFLPFMNASLAEKLHSIQIYANGYKLDDLGPEDFRIDRSRCEPGIPSKFSDVELQDPWVRIRPANGSSTFNFRFGGMTPRRVLEHNEPADSPPPPELA